MTWLAFIGGIFVGAAILFFVLIAWGRRVMGGRDD